MGPPIWEKNYSSATGPDTFQLVEAQIQTEIINGRYIPVPTPPLIISALGAVPKCDKSQVRLIHDCSRPHGTALNDLAFAEKFRYQSLQDATRLIKPHSYLAKLDLAAAYRSVKLHPDDWPVSGLAWTFSGDKDPTFLQDTRLMFGAKKSPYIFHQLSQAVCRIMATQGFPSITCYLDDFLVISDSFSQCISAINHLIKLLRSLGFAINYKKLEGPAQVLTYLGIELHVPDQVLRLPNHKLESFLADIRHMYQASSASKRQLQSLIGKLSWACQVIHGGRPHLRRLIDRVNLLKSPRHRTRITMDMRKDLAWWIAFARIFNGSVPMLAPSCNLSVSIDACNSGAGGFFNGSFFHLNWSDWPAAQDLHINMKEVLALEPAISLWAPHWANHRINVYSDNQTAVAIINKGSSKDPLVMASLRRIFWWTAVYNIRLRARYYPGYCNTLADACSRLPSPTAWQTLAAALPHTILDHHHGCKAVCHGSSAGTSTSNF